MINLSFLMASARARIESMSSPVLPMQNIDIASQCNIYHIYLNILRTILLIVWCLYCLIIVVIQDWNIVILSMSILDLVNSREIYYLPVNFLCSFDLQLSLLPRVQVKVTEL